MNLVVVSGYLVVLASLVAVLAPLQRTLQQYVYEAHHIATPQQNARVAHALQRLRWDAQYSPEQVVFLVDHKENDQPAASDAYAIVWQCRDGIWWRNDEALAAVHRVDVVSVGNATTACHNCRECRKASSGRDCPGQCWNRRHRAAPGLFARGAGATICGGNRQMTRCPVSQFSPPSQKRGANRAGVLSLTLLVFLSICVLLITVTGPWRVHWHRAAHTASIVAQAREWVLAVPRAQAALHAQTAPHAPAATTIDLPDGWQIRDRNDESMPVREVWHRQILVLQINQHSGEEMIVWQGGQ